MKPGTLPHTRRREPGRHLSRLVILVLTLAGLAAACAPLPQQHVSHQEERQLSLPQATISTQLTTRWWQHLGDARLGVLIAQAIEAQPTLQAAQARIEAASRVERLAELQTGLQYDTALGLQRQRLSDHGLLPSALIGKMYTQAGISQQVALDLDWWGRNRALLQAARLEHAALHDERLAAEQVLAAALADAYYAWAGVLREQRLSQRMQALQEQIIALQTQRHQLGLDSEAPGEQARLELQQIGQQLQQLDYAAASWRYRLAALLSQDPLQGQRLEQPGLPQVLPDALATLPSQLPLDLLAQRADVASLKQRLLAASSRVEASEAEFYPAINLGLMLGFESLELDKLLNAGSLVAGLGAAVHLPIFNGRTLRARLGVREAEYAQAVALYNHSILEAARQAGDAQALNLALDQRAGQQAQSLQHARRLHELARSRQQLGLDSPLQRLQAELNHYQQAKLAAQLMSARLRARIALFYALGGQPGPKEAS